MIIIFQKRVARDRERRFRPSLFQSATKKSPKWGFEPALPRSHETRSSIAPFDQETLTMQVSLRGSGLADELVQPKQAAQDESNHHGRTTQAP